MRVVFVVWVCVLQYLAVDARMYMDTVISRRRYDYCDAFIDVDSERIYIRKCCSV